MSDESRIVLQNNNLLKNTDINYVNIGNKIGSLKSINVGEVVYRDGDPADSVYMILNGEINLVKKNKNGKSQSVVFAENDFFGAKELFSNVDRCTTTVSLSDAYLVKLNKEEIEYLIEQDEKVARNIQKGNKDFKFEENIIEILEIDNNLNLYEENYEHEENIFDQNSISKIIDEIERQERMNTNNFIENDSVDTISEDLLCEEKIDNEKKIKYYWEIKDHKKIEENFMSEENNLAENNTSYLSTDQFDMIVKSLQLLNANVKRDDVLNNIVDVAVNITNADRGTLYLVEKETNEIWSKALIGDGIEEIRLKVGEGLAGWVAEKGEILSIPDVSQDERFDDSFDNATGYSTKNMLVYPIKNKTDETVGVLQLLNSVKGSFSRQEEIFLNAISLNAALALENASLVEQLLHSERDTSLGKMGNFLTYDLKRPILTCKRYAEHLLKKDLEFDVKQIVKLLDEQLDQVANQLISASDFTEGTTLLRRQQVSVNDTLFDFSSRTHSLVKTHNCKIENEFTDDVNINVDTKEFYQCYYNIIKNGCEALPEGGHIVVKTEKKDDIIEISFNDKGVGIDGSDLKFVFDPLWSKNKRNNSGLGLSISKKIVEDHEGSISIVSNKEDGTTIKIGLPIQ